LTPNFRH